MTRTLVPTRQVDSERLLGALALLLGGMGLVKFLGIMAIEGVANSPWFFLLVLVAPFLLGRVLLATHVRAGAALLGVFAALFAVVCAVAVVQGIEPYWADYVLVLVGGPLAALAAALSVRVLRSPAASVPGER